MDYKYTKGTQTGVMIMTAVMVLAFIMGVQTLPLNQALANEISDNYKDLPRISQAKTFGENIHFNEGLPAAEHSVNQKSYDLGQVKGGFKWSYNIPPDSKITKKLENRSENYFNKNYKSKGTLSSCKIPTINHTLDIELKDNFVEFNVTSYGESKSEAPEVICDFPETNISYSGEEPSYDSNFRESKFSTIHEAISNRYGPLSRTTRRYAEKIKNEYSSDSNSPKVEAKTGTSSTVCDENGGVEDQPHKINAMQSALKNVEGSITGSKNEAWNRFKRNMPEWMDKNKDNYDKSSTFKWSSSGPSVSTNIFTGSISTKVKNSCTNCCGTSNNYDREYAWAKVTPIWTELDLVFEEDTTKDSHYKILTKNGWKHLEFRVEPWTHSLP